MDQLRLDQFKVDQRASHELNNLINHRVLTQPELHNNQRNRQPPLRQHSLSRVDERRLRDGDKHGGQREYYTLQRDGDRYSMKKDVISYTVQRDGQRYLLHKDGDKSLMRRDGDKSSVHKDEDKHPPSKDGDKYLVTQDGDKYGLQRVGERPPLLKEVQRYAPQKEVKRQLSLRDTCSSVQVVDRYGTMKEVKKYSTLREGDRYASLRDVEKYATLRGGVHRDRSTVQPGHVHLNGDQPGDTSNLDGDASAAKSPAPVQDQERGLSRTSSIQQLENWVRTHRKGGDEDTRR